MCTSAKPIVAGDGPIVVQVEYGKQYLWCTCGASKKQPFCDGSHKGTPFKPLKFKADHTEMALCSCKATQNGPKCDGSHDNTKMEGASSSWW